MRLQRRATARQWLIPVSRVSILALVLAAYFLVSHFRSPSLPVIPFLPTIDRVALAWVCYPDQARQFQIHNRYEWERGTVLTYTVQCPPGSEGPKDLSPGFMLLKRDIFGWQELYRTGERQATPGQLVDYESGGRKGGEMGDYAYVYGKVLAPSRVAVVEALFDNGRILRSGADGGVYVLLAPDSNGPCELRALDSDNQVLERFDLIESPGTLPPLPDDGGAHGTSWIGVSLASTESCGKVQE